MLIDTHSHIYAEEFDNDRDEVISRAIAAGVGMILLPAIDKESYDRQEQLACSNPKLFRQMMGLHPTSVDANYEIELMTAKKRLFDSPDKYCGVGEIGLDLYWDTSFREEQADALMQQICLAEELKKPFVLHLRNGNDGSGDNDAYRAAFRLLEQHGSTSYKGVMHCFSGTAEDARKAVDMGFLLGVGGVVTYKKNTLKDIVQELPLENIVLETDAPYLAPVPYRGRRNESAYVSIVADKIAEIKGCDVALVAETTTQNALQLFSNLTP